MNEQELFAKYLKELTEFAAANENKINASDIDDAFSDMKLNEKQLDMIYSYMKLNKIAVIKNGEEYQKEDWQYDENPVQSDEDDAVDAEYEGVISDKLEEDAKADSEIVMSEEEALFLDMYMEEISSIEKLNEDEIMELVKNIEDEVSKKRLIENYLINVMDWIKPYRNRGILYGDLIQEANIGLMDSIGKIDKDMTELSEIEDFIKINTVKYIKSIIDEFESSIMVSDKVLNRVNAVNDCAAILAEDLGRRPTKSEVAKMMNIELDELDDIIKLSADKIDSIAK